VTLAGAAAGRDEHRHDQRGGHDVVQDDVVGERPPAGERDDPGEQDGHEQDEQDLRVPPREAPEDDEGGHGRDGQQLPGLHAGAAPDRQRRVRHERDEREREHRDCGQPAGHGPPVRARPSPVSR
jgi:hypothetical protein